MATDPVESIQSEERQTPFSSNLQRRVRDLAHLEPSRTHQYLSAYIDWRPEGENPGVRPGKITLEHQLSKLRRDLHDAGADTREVEANAQKIIELVEDGIDPAVHGIFVLACDASNVFETVYMAIPMDTDVAIGPTPKLRQLAATIEDHPRFAVLHADQHDASLFVVNRASPQSELSMESNEYPRKQHQGGWSQRRFQARQDERLHHFAKAVAEEVRRVLSEEEISMLVLSVGEVFGSALNEEWHSSVKSMVVGEISHGPADTESEIIEKAQKVAEQAERNNAAENIKTFEDAVGSGNQGAAGPDDVLMALESGQVMTLLMASDFEATGWADFELGLYGTGDIPAEHPAGGDVENLTRIDLAEEFVRLGLSTGAEVEIVASRTAASLHKHGGVGAILRY
ncbi:MAG TPA: Vms1/Ankzf1 family peptidyl-tRNA hydrolase [Thermomicrobiales bacterium]|nr:Vms1/Ankzf1 family peptidyl-tRNA hydrolase [Thermomicrobiales bacterium]